MQHLAAPYTEVWVPTPIIPLVQFAHRVRSIAATGIDTLGLGDRSPEPSLVESLASFDEIVSWYGTKRPDFRAALSSINSRTVFLEALPTSLDLHATDFHAKAVGAPLGMIPKIEVSPTPREAIVIHPFSGGRTKNWPLEKFRELARSLTLPLEWVSGPDEPLDSAHQFDNLLELGTWIAGARLFIGNDSGITHLAAATGVPVIAFFGPTNPTVWAPRNATVLRFKPGASQTFVRRAPRE